MSIPTTPGYASRQPDAERGYRVRHDMEMQRHHAIAVAAGNSMLLNKAGAFFVVQATAWDNFLYAHRHTAGPRLSEDDVRQWPFRERTFLGIPIRLTITDPAGTPDVQLVMPRVMVNRKIWTPPPPLNPHLNAETLFAIGWPWAWPGVPAAAVRCTVIYAWTRLGLAGRRLLATVIKG